MNKDPYKILLNRKRTWTPVKPTAGKLVDGSEKVIRRALAIRHMELPVGGFIREALERTVPESARTLLESNIIDEERHDLALNYVAEVHGVDEQSEAEALRLRQAWVDHPDHTVFKALVAERAIFFVLLPLFRFLGDSGLRTVSADISRDETLHVACNTLVAQELGLKLSPSLDRLRIETVQWIMEPLGKSDNKYLDRQFWLNQSDGLMYQGKAPGLIETKRARMPAFFEHSNVNLPQYS